MKKGVLFKSIRVFIVIAFSLAVAVALVALRPRAQRQPPPKAGRLVEVLSVLPRSVTMPVKAFGTILPREKLLLVAGVGGEITYRNENFSEGCCVSAGTVLATVDPVPYSLEVDRSRGQVENVDARMEKLRQDVKNLNADLAIAGADLKLADNEFHRLEDLHKSSVSSKANRDRAEQGALASRAKRQAIENRLSLIEPSKAGLASERKIALAIMQKAQYNLERTRITAPFSGWVLEEKIETGQHVHAGQYLGSIYRTRALDVEVSVPLGELRWLRDENRAVSEFMAEIVIPGDGTGRKWSGRLARVKAGLDEKTRMQRLVIEIEDQTTDAAGCPQGVNLGALRPGMFVAVEIRGTRIDNIFGLPRYVVQAGDVVFVAAGDTLEIKPVRVVRRLGETVYIDRGITEGDLIIKTPLAGISGGEKIRIKR